MDMLYPLIRQLADGRFHSGEQLAEVANISRAAIWKQVKRLREQHGLKIDAVHGKGYRLREPIDLLDRELMVDATRDKINDFISHFYILPTVVSTNSYLLEREKPAAGTGMACVAEHQSAGKGRRGRSWISPFGQSIFLSLGWTFDLPLAKLSGVSIAAGVAVARMLARAGVENHCLKWPNDVHIDGQKIAGILVEAGGEVDGPGHAVIGVGINLRVQAEAMESVEQPWTDLYTVLGGVPDRNRMVADLLEELIATCRRYQESGLSPFLAEWQKFDDYRGQLVTLINGEHVLQGQYSGLNSNGGLILETVDGRSVHYSGEVSMRLAKLR